MARGKDPNVKQLTSERRILTMTKERQNNGRSCDPAVLVQTNMLGCEDATRRNCSKLRDLSGLVFRLVFSWIAKIASDRSPASKPEADGLCESRMMRFVCSFEWRSVRAPHLTDRENNPNPWPLTDTNVLRLAPRPALRTTTRRPTRAMMPHQSCREPSDRARGEKLQARHIGGPSSGADCRLFRYQSQPVQTATSARQTARRTGTIICPPTVESAPAPYVGIAVIRASTWSQRPHRPPAASQTRITGDLAQK
jgi:hypothetical protein